MVDRVEDFDVWQDRLGIFMLTRVAGTFFLNSFFREESKQSHKDGSSQIEIRGDTVRKTTDSSLHA